MTLRELKIGKSAKIISVGGEGALRQHFLDMGVIPGAELTVIKYAPMGDPLEIEIQGYRLTLRLAEAEQIEIEEIAELSKETTNKSELDKNDPVKKKTVHPGLGETGIYHPKGSGNPLPDRTTLTFALVGNQNSGKTTLFNQLTGSKQHVGNFPGVTVDRKDGEIRGYKNTLITDLPGIYSMSPYTSEEIVSRNHVLNEKPTAIINIVDATNVERNLYLTMQLLEMDVPTVVALNMMDELKGNGGVVDINRMEEMLGTPVVPIAAAKNEGVDELITHALHIAKYQEKPLEQDFCSKDDNGGIVHKCLHTVMNLIADNADKAGLPLRFTASKVVEGDALIIDKLALDDNEKEAIEHIVSHMEKETGLDRSAAIADMRFKYIRKVCQSCVTKPKESKEQIRSNKIDRILTGKYTAIPMFILIMGLVFVLTFNVIGAWLQGILEEAIGALQGIVGNAMQAGGVNAVLQGLVVKGIFEGVGSVLSFLPIIVVLFFFLSLMEDSGYIARVAFVMDKLLRKIGLSGRSIVPLLIGFGCTVPAVMSTRTLPSERDRKMTIVLTPFMSCTAKLPIYAFFVNAFFPGKGGLIITALYVWGIVIGIFNAYISKKTVFKGEPVPFVMELPNYRLPSPRSVMQLLWEKSKDFIQRAFSVIFIATIVVWLLSNFDLHFNLVADSKESILAFIAGIIAPVFAPLGLGDWRICTSLISGFIAKESVVSVLGVLFVDGVEKSLSTVTAITLLVFSLLYTPCVAAIAAIKRELGKKWAIAVVLWQCAVAWIVAFAVRLVALLIIR
ncbi:ferrous iron transport protein FeoA/B [Butyrivibrio proteoclasticus B316]|uniref:Ferrous iron transport protein B n=1 Tax=Butyrivibrio proteoclasticus (strain ATCC 51982 / DSM 14932 / B316) TaxID=515622 RepID=E0RY68_BUTPB|nr:ferrous iron transport protein B [Butyrivibrio proteoclasticus]ADL35023.1 ferrous iron transport protein FeoA/B [Butyrivibrio proteoclasticus B316]